MNGASMSQRFAGSRSFDHAPWTCLGWSSFFVFRPPAYIPIPAMPMAVKHKMALSYIRRKIHNICTYATYEFSALWAASHVFQIPKHNLDKEFLGYLVHSTFQYRLFIYGSQKAPLVGQLSVTSFLSFRRSFLRPVALLNGRSLE